MAVVLLLSDGTTKEYPVVSRARIHLVEGDPRTKCGAPDCEHLDCAAGFAEKKFMRLQTFTRWAMFFGAMLFVITLSTVPRNFLNNLSINTPLHFLGPAIALGGLFYLKHRLTKAMKLQGDTLWELQEFRNQKTINGLAARQIFQKLPSHETEMRG